MSKLSRRSLVAGAASVPIAAAASSSALADGEDAELVRLAAEVQKTWVELGDAISAADGAMGGPDEAEAESAQGAVSDRMSGAIDAMAAIRAQSIRGLAAKARVADLMCRENGEVHSSGSGRRDAWMVIDDLLAMGDHS